jgi:ABC-type amino acid transport substrate-binding protein
MGPRGEIEGSLSKGKPGNIAVQSLVTPGLSNGQWAMGLAVKATYSKLAEELNTVMADMVSDGTVSAIFKRHKVTHFSPAEAPK